MRVVVVLFALLSLAVLAPAAGGQQQGRLIEVKTLAGAFSPETLELRPGDTVVWTNDDGRGHTVTSGWDEGKTFHRVLRPGESFSVQFLAAGEYAIRCVPHSVVSDHGGHVGMVQTLTVVAPAAATQESGEASAFNSRLLLVPLALGLLALVAYWLKNGVPGVGKLPRARRQ